MKRHWEFHWYFDKFRIRFFLDIGFPHEDDYFTKQYHFHLELFGLSFNIDTWKE